MKKKKKKKKTSLQLFQVIYITSSSYGSSVSRICGTRCIRCTRSNNHFFLLKKNIFIQIIIFLNECFRPWSKNICNSFFIFIQRLATKSSLIFFFLYVVCFLIYVYGHITHDCIIFEKKKITKFALLSTM